MKLTHQLILASNSPRRKEILEKAGFEFSIQVKEIDECFPDTMPVEEVAPYLAKQKALAFGELSADSLVITADTVVIAEGQILNKPQDKADAERMLWLLSNRVHEVVTGVCIRTNEELISFSDKAYVTIKKLTKEEIDYYIETCKPFDKAGAYGIQDFFGMVCVQGIQGSFYTVMGLPAHALYEKLLPWQKK
ncbi:MAG: Maf family nucleotide pyrophosphatase [Spirosomataceae bacterium]